MHMHRNRERKISAIINPSLVCLSVVAELNITPYINNETKPTCMVCAYESEDPYIFLQGHSQWHTPEMRHPEWCIVKKTEICMWNWVISYQTFI